MPVKNIAYSLKRNASYISGFILFQEPFIMNVHQQEGQIKSRLDSLHSDKSHPTPYI